MAHSGLISADQIKIWILSDTLQRGALDKGDFAAAMHLITREENGHPLPDHVSPELVFGSFVPSEIPDPTRIQVCIAFESKLFRHHGK